MNRTSLITCVSLAAIALAAPAASAAEFKPYVSVFGGVSLLNDLHITNFNNKQYTWNFNGGYNLGGAVGVKWNDLLRTELELSHSVWSANHWTHTGDGGYAGAASGNLQATYLLGNVWFDVATNSMVTPYIGGGLGVGWANANVTPGKGYQLLGGNSGFAFQLGAGLKFAVSESVDIDLGYRFKDITNITFSDQYGNPWSPTNLVSHNFQLGVTLKF